MKRRILIILIVLLSSLCYAQVTNYPLHNFLMLQPVQENDNLCLTNCSIEIKVDEGEFAFISLNGYHKSAVLKTPIKKVNYDTIHKRIQRTGNFIV